MNPPLVGEFVLTPRVCIVGAGPAGLRAATDIAPLVDGEVLVLEREAEAGGIPRHSDHLGYGIRDLGRFTTGPRYARTLRQRALAAGADIRTNAMATGWLGETSLAITSPEGRGRVDADVVILATGARERPRAARLIPGARSEGVYTTGQLQNLVHLKHRAIGQRAVVVGAELVSWSAVLTLKHAGCNTALMVTEHERPESYAVFNALGRGVLRTPVATSTKLVRIVGDERVSGVEIENLKTGQRRFFDCDTVIVTGDWIPDNELAREAGLELDVVSKAPITDSGLRTSKSGVFAIGNLLHPVDTADVAALDGAAVAPHVLAYLAGAREQRRFVDLVVEPPLRWVSPARIDLADPHPPRDRLLLWTDELRMLAARSASPGGQSIAYQADSLASRARTYVPDSRHRYSTVSIPMAELSRFLFRPETSGERWTQRNQFVNGLQRVGGQLEVCALGVWLRAFRFARPDDRRGNTRLVQHPCDCYLRDGRTDLIADAAQTVDHFSHRLGVLRCHDPRGNGYVLPVGADPPLANLLERCVSEESARERFIDRDCNAAVRRTKRSCLGPRGSR